jgi:hypothetical protein
MLLVPGQTPLWSQNSEPPLNGSDKSLQTWETLSAQGRTIYETQKYNLDELRTEISSLRSGFDGLTHSYEMLLQSNEDLNRFSVQVGERMQMKDEDLAEAYDVIDGQDGTIRHLTGTVIVLGAPYLIMLIVWAVKKFMGR